jgi:hypothetical protein
LDQNLDGIGVTSLTLTIAFIDGSDEVCIVQMIRYDSMLKKLSVRTEDYVKQPLQAEK